MKKKKIVKKVIALATLVEELTLVVKDHIDHEPDQPEKLDALQLADVDLFRLLLDSPEADHLSFCMGRFNFHARRTAIARQWKWQAKNQATTLEEGESGNLTSAVMQGLSYYMVYRSEIQSDLVAASS